MALDSSNSQFLQQYKYPRRITPGTIRILKLFPAGHEHASIDCELIESPTVCSDGTQQYEALSYCWGVEDKTMGEWLRMHHDHDVFSFAVSQALALALRALRNVSVRYLWVDAICINQGDTQEKNVQVPRMNQVYGNASNVCIWLGEADSSSKVALEFVRSKILSDLWNFDKFCESAEMAHQWASLTSLMRRPWFSRRWVVQEIALARSATLHCGGDSIDWKDFVDAVLLLTRVAPLLTGVMRQEARISDYFGHVPALGAALLVDATSKLFQRSNKGRRALLTLEELVVSLSVFGTTQPRDTIYALLSLARDTVSQATQGNSSLSPAIQSRLNSLGQRYTPNRGYSVDYELPVVEVFKEFVVFSIRKAEPIQALDIICRPWAPRAKKSDDLVRSSNMKLEQAHMTSTRLHPIDEDDLIPLPSWISDLEYSAFSMSEHPTAGLRMERKNADPLVGLPRKGQRLYSAAGSRPINLTKLRFGTGHYSSSMFVEGFILDRLERKEEASRLGNIPSSWLRLGGWNYTNEDPPSPFWRTLIADRGPNGEAPPAYYARACKQSIKNARPGGILDTERIISEGNSTIIAEYFRRVQTVVWNKCLARTAETHLALVHENAAQADAICVLYGCSVPVILRRMVKSDQDIDNERANEEMEMSKRERRALKLLESAMKKRRSINLSRSRKNDRPQTFNYEYSGCILLSLFFVLCESHQLDTLIAPIFITHLLVWWTFFCLLDRVIMVEEALGLDRESLQAQGSSRYWSGYTNTSWLLIVYKMSNQGYGDIPLYSAVFTLLFDITFVIGQISWYRIKLWSGWPKLPIVQQGSYQVTSWVVLLGVMSNQSYGKLPDFLIRWFRLLAISCLLWDFIWYLTEPWSTWPKRAPRKQEKLHQVDFWVVLLAATGRQSHGELTRWFLLVAIPCLLLDTFSDTIRPWSRRPKKAPKLPIVQLAPRKVHEPDPYYWVLIGECYIHGFMDGEAIAFQNANNIRPQTFELR